MKKRQQENNNLEEFEIKLIALLKEYNCRLMSDEAWDVVLIVDRKTDETINVFCHE